MHVIWRPCLCLQVGVLSPLGRNFYLNITPNNLVHLYLRADAVPEGSPTSVRIRELNSTDWDTTATGATEPSCSSRRLLSIQPPVTSCFNGRIAPNCASLTTQCHKNIVTNPMHKQSLSELVSSLKNCSSVRTQAPSQASALKNTYSQSFIPSSSCGNLSESESLCSVRTAPLKLHDWPNISHTDQTYVSHSHSTAAQQALTVPESQCLQTPSQVTGAKFRFKRTPTTPVLSHVQLSVSTQQTTASHMQQSSPASVGVTSRSHSHLLMSTSVSPAVSAISQAANTAVDDMWVTGTLKLSHSPYVELP